MKQRIISLLLAAALILTILQQISISVFAADTTEKFRSVAVSDNNTAAITTNGDLYMWGFNDDGQVGNGTTTHQKTPVKVLSNVASVSLSAAYCAAITTNGDLYMWGYNSQGQVGNGTTTHQKTPVKVLSNVASVSLSNTYCAAITTSGDLYMWGANDSGQVGNGTTSNQKTPVKVLSNVASVSLSDSHSAAITTSGDLYMWGCNSQGQVGNGTTTDQKTPVKVLSNVTSVSLTSCSAAITTNGDLYTWGSNDYSQLGNGTTTHQKTPVKVLSNVASVSLSYWHFAAITTNGDLYLWGANGSGQVGNGTTTDQKTPVKALSNVEFVNSGSGGSAAITANGDLYMWGLNHRGQVGNGTTTNQETPVKVLSNVTSVSLSYWHFAAITTNGDLYMWGANDRGQVGNGTTTDQKTPVKVLSNVEFVNSSGWGHTSAITTNGDLYIWGANDSGEVGNGTTADQLTPYKIEIPGSSAASNESFNTFFVNNYYDNLNALYNYESAAQGILADSSSFQIVWNTCLQALSNSNYIDISKLKNHPEYYYEVVLVEAISQKELNDDYLSALKAEAFDLVLDAADVFISYDANFNSREEILEAKLTKTINLFDGTSEGAHALYQAFMGCISYKSYKDFYDEAKFIYDACKEAGSTCGDFLTELSNYQVAQQASTEVIEALKYLRSTLEDSPSKEDKNIVSAIDDFIKCYSESIEENTLRQASKAIDEQLRGTLFRAAKLIPIFGNAVDLEQAGLNAVFTFSDVLFPTTMSSESYCKIYADYAMECVLRNAMQSAYSSRSTVGDDVIVGLYDLLGYIFKHEIRVSKVLSKQIYQDGLINGLRNLFPGWRDEQEYVKACIAAYQADLNQILGEKTDAFREYGFAIGTLQPVTIVYFLNGKVIDCKERTVETGSTFSPSSVTVNLGFFLNTKIEIASYYTDAALTKPYNENQSIYSPLSLYCNLIEIDFSINVPIIRDYSTGIYVEQNGIDETAILQTEEKLDGTSYDLIKNTLKSNAFSLYDISLLKNGSPVQPTETVTVRIPISEADTKKTGKVYRVENNSKFTDMASWIEGGYYCFNTNHFSEYVVAFEPLISDDVICDGGVNCPSNKFIDVNQKEWYHPYVDYAVTHGLFGGTSENTFEPDSTMTRSMLVAVLWRYEGQPKGYKNTFADVNAKNGGWYIDAVAWAAANNICGGVGGGKFDPEGIVTREQMATILYRYSEWKGFDTSKRADFSSFPDANKVSSWAKTAMKWAVAEGLIGGSKEGNATYILPTNGATRAQVATILMRYIQGTTNEKPSSGESYHIALITDYGDIHDGSFNQVAYEASRAWCEKNAVDFTYYKPIEDNTVARVAVIDQAVADGYNVLILPGYMFADPIVETAGLYPDVRFIGLDISEADLKFAAYDNPTYTCPSNVFCALYKEEIGGFMAGYAAVKLGYTKLGFLGGLPVPAVVRYGYGFIQGVDTASTELGIKTEIRYVYGNQFFGDADITAYMENWYRSGTQVVFACGGGIFTSAAEAAQKYSGKLIGLDVDQASTIDELYGTGMTVTSAMKGLGETVTFMLDELISGRWNVHGGKVETLGLISGSDPSANFVQLPDSTQWNSGFTKSDYAALVSKIYNGTYIVSADIDIMPTTKSVTVLNEGAIKS